MIVSPNSQYYINHARLGWARDIGFWRFSWKYLKYFDRGIIRFSDLVAIVLKRELSILDLTVDHFTPRSGGGKDRNDNLLTCCWLCNRRKSHSTFGTLEDAVRFVAQQKQLHESELVNQVMNLSGYTEHQRNLAAIALLVDNEKLSKDR